MEAFLAVFSCTNQNGEGDGEARDEVVEGGAIDDFSNA